MARNRKVANARTRYGTEHRKLRAQLAPHVAAGTVQCARCFELIEIGQPWDLGHSEDDPEFYTGAEHRSCNRRAAAEKRRRLHGPYRGRKLPPVTYGPRAGW